MTPGETKTRKPALPPDTPSGVSAARVHRKTCSACTCRQCKAHSTKRSSKQRPQCSAQVRDPGIPPNFFLHWHWRMQARLGSSEVRLQAGDIPNARIEVDDLLESALSTADPHLQALAWEMKTRVAMAEQDWMGAREYLQQAVV